MDQKIIQLRKAQMKIALEVKRVCEKYNIKYFLDAGSMLGAVRHRGYIPWDDDMDIGMTKENYNKFLTVAEKELGQEFFLDNYDTNEENALVFTKIRLKGTKYIEKKGNPLLQHNEIFVDIFPYYYISDNKQIRNMEALAMSIFSKAILSKSGYKVWAGDKWIKRIKFIPTDFLGCILTKRYMHKVIEKMFNRHQGTKCMCIHAGSGYNYWHIKKEVLDEQKEIVFEGECFKIPQNYNYYLTQIYGDYMTLPPENERVTHQIQELDLGDYKF